jgi:hypothetical protein
MSTNCLSIIILTSTLLLSPIPLLPNTCHRCFSTGCPWRYNLSVLATNSDELLTTRIEDEAPVCGSGNFYIDPVPDSDPNRAAGFVVPPPTLDRTGQVGAVGLAALLACEHTTYGIVL